MNNGQAISRSYGRFFAEFLKEPLLVRLGLLDLTTCVGLRYDLHTYNLEVFLGNVLLYIEIDRSRSLYA